MQEEFKIPKNANIPTMKKIATVQNAAWILRNAFINNPPQMALEIKAVVKDWLARNGHDTNKFLIV